ncbi:MAG: outer membrane beta-barrel protein, partial [Rhizobiaceae bacterium]|nr:outer membrane beta-barrel protein [Rhizobiaceae bacterium]
SVARRERPGVPQLAEETPLPPNAASRRLDAEDIERGAIGPDAERTGGIEARGTPADTSPFAPTGIRAGSFVLRPSLEQGAEWSSNASGSAGGSSDILSSTTLRLGIESDWSRHALSLNTFGTYRRSLQGTGFSELTAGLDGSLRLDLGGGFVSTTALGYQRRPESAELAVNTVGRPLRQTFSASTEMAKTIGPVLLSARAAADRNVYADATLDTGGTVSQADRNNTLYGLTLRGGYQVSPALQPFVEAEIGRRIHDARLDSGGFARSATRYGARAGLAFDRGEKFSGEVAAGFLTERPDDSRLASVSGATLDGTLTWSPLRGTQVDLGATTEIDASALAGSAGALVYGVSLGASRELGARLTGSALLSAQLRRFAGTSDSDTTLAGSASLTWWMNRYAGITGRVGHERLSSTVAGRGYGSTTVYLGLTLQR